MKKTFHLLFLIFLYQASFCQPVTLTGENYLLLNGERFKNQKVILTKADGDWYATATDGHGAIAFYGNYDGRQMRLDIEWDGKNEPHLITNEIRHNGKRTGEFIITMSDKAVYGDGLNAYPSEEDEINIKINKADGSNVSGEMTGTITQGREKVSVNGVFNLKRATSAKSIVNSSYKDCDNVVHDKLIGAEGRSPSECEAKYDLDVRTAIHDAVAQAIEKFQQDGWLIRTQTSLEPLFVVGRGSEKDLFSTSYEIEMQLSQTSEVYSNYHRQLDEISQKLRDGKETIDNVMKFNHQMYGAVNCDIHFTVNNHSVGFGNYRGGSKVTKLSSNVFVVQAPYVQSRSGGGEDNAVDATIVLIGNWKQPVIEKLDGGGEDVRSTALLNPSAGHLQTQNIVIRIESNAAIANEFIKNLDLEKLSSLLK